MKRAWVLILLLAAALALAGIGLVATGPCGQRIWMAVSGSGVPSTSMALSCDQYPLPACSSRTGPARCPNINLSCAPIPRGLPAGPLSHTLSPGLPPKL